MTHILRPSLAARCLAAASLAIAMLTAPAGAQPDRQGREVLRERLERRLEEVRQQERRLAAAIEAIDRGEEPQGLPDLAPLGRGEWQRGRGPDADGRELPGGGPAAASEEEVMVFLDRAVPPIARRLREVRDSEPWVVDRMVRRLGTRVAEIRVAREHDPELASLMVAETRSGLLMMEALRDVHRAVAGGDDGEVETAVGALRSALEAQFDARIKRREHEIASLGRRIEGLRSELEQQHAEREAAIDRAVREALDRARRTPPGRRPDGPRGGQR